jgi:radical SAM superfamily enzyme YgiQ (UPF0313 family)
LKILLIIPPFSQINTVYPSVTNLAAYLQQEGYDAESFDLSLEVILEIFSKNGLTKIFEEAEKTKNHIDDSIKRILNLKHKYLSTIDIIINFLQGKNQNFAPRIIQDEFLPQGNSFSNLLKEDLSFGYFGTNDKANYYCSLVLDDLSQFIRKTISPYFGLSRYAEKIAISSPHFKPFQNYLDGERNLIDKIIEEATEKKIVSVNPDIAGYSIPFPGNLLGALISADKVKKINKDIKIVFGGGYVNTELRKISDTGIFKYTDYLTFDDGELPLKRIVTLQEKKITKEKLIRTAICINKKVEKINFLSAENISFNEIPAPSLKGITPDEYISMTEILNPMLKLWTDGYLNKLAIAHGCYWKKCTFCDVTLDYIGRYAPAEAKVTVDRMEKMIKESRRIAFHFTDEAAPPKLLKNIAIEILRRKLTVSWWGNIRFEESFTPDLCRLLAESGCVAVSGGLEVANDRLLKLINKGLTVAQTAGVCKNFRDAGILVHTYLMYGYPTQTDQETIDSLEMVRQLFKLNLVNSGFWHRFALTIHSPIAQNPESYKIKIISSTGNPFGNNELLYTDLTKNDPAKFGPGLRKAIYNYMHGNLIDENTSDWFDFKVPGTSISNDYIAKSIILKTSIPSPDAQCIWQGSLPAFSGKPGKNNKIIIHSAGLIGDWKLTDEIGKWLINMAGKSQIKRNNTLIKFSDWQNEFPGGVESFNLLVKKPIWKEIRSNFLICV